MTSSRLRLRARSPRTEGQGLQSLVNGTRPEPGGHPRKQTALTWLIVGKQNAAGTMRGSGGAPEGSTALATEHPMSPDEVIASAHQIVDQLRDRWRESGLPVSVLADQMIGAAITDLTNERGVDAALELFARAGRRH
jgi:hypothetical protein